MPKKTAMVQPPPAKKSPPAKKYSLEEVLHLARNDRAYTVVVQAVDHWIVHFSGDLAPSMVKVVNGKPVIIRNVQ